MRVSEVEGMRRSAVMACSCADLHLPPAPARNRRCDPKAIAQRNPSSPPRLPPRLPLQQQGATAANPAQTVAAISAARMKFAPIVGATVEAATPLTDASHQGARARHPACRQRGHGGDPCAERLFLGDHRREQDDGHLCLGRARSRRQPAAPHPGPAAGARRERKAGPRFRPTMQAIADQTIDQLATRSGTRRAELIPEPKDSQAKGV